MGNSSYIFQIGDENINVKLKEKFEEGEKTFEVYKNEENGLTVVKSNGKSEVLRYKGVKVQVWRKVTKQVKIFEKNTCGKKLKDIIPSADLTDVNVRLSL